MRTITAAVLLLVSLACHAETPQQIRQTYVSEASSQQADFTPSAKRGEAVTANAERFSDPAKVEKWFGRNCKEVVGRACTSAEKADFMTYLSEVR